MKFWAGFCFALVAAWLHTSSVAAVGLQIAPQRYEAVLSKDSVKKGFIDISNPGPAAAKVTLDVQGFRQIANDGSLEFYADRTLREAIRTDFDQLTIGPRESYRVFFLIDGQKLPEGDVFAAVFASTVPDGEHDGTQQAIRVGTLLLLQNGTRVDHRADVVRLNAPLFQFGDSVRAELAVKNVSDPAVSPGFIPRITMQLKPYAVTTVQGPLVFAGRTRTVVYQQPGSYFGPMLMEATAGGSAKSRWVFAMTGYWQWLAPLLLLGGIALFVVIRWRVFGNRTGVRRTKGSRLRR